MGRECENSIFCNIFLATLSIAHISVGIFHHWLLKSNLLCIMFVTDLLSKWWYIKITLLKWMVLRASMKGIAIPAAGVAFTGRFNHDGQAFLEKTD